MRSKYWPAYTWKIQTSYLSKINSISKVSSQLSKEELKQLIANIFEKINGSFYHFEKIKENQDVALKIGEQLSNFNPPEIKDMKGVAAVHYEPIGYEYESFLITIKTCLDLIAILVAKSSGRKEQDIISLYTNLYQTYKNNSLDRDLYKIILNKKFITLYTFFKDPDKRKNKRSPRNFAVHHGPIPISQINIPINNPSGDIRFVQALDPYNPVGSLNPNKTNLLTDTCESIFYATSDLFIGVLSEVTKHKFTPGSKGSVFSQRTKNPS